MHDFTYFYELSRVEDDGFLLVKLGRDTVTAKDKKEAVAKVSKLLGTHVFQLERGGQLLYSGLEANIAYMFPR
jgi:hypothetical protein